jgi:hypothetical protein
LSVDDLIAGHVEARGGLDRILAIMTLRQVGKVKTPRTEIILRGERMRPDLLRIEYVVDGTTGMEGWDGTGAWELNPWKGMTEAEYVSGPPAISLRRGSEFDGPLVWHQDKGHTIEAADSETLDGLEVYTLKVTLADGNVIYHYLDAGSLLVARTRSVRHIHGGEAAETVTVYEDYREVAGVLFPFRWREQARDGAHSEAFEWEKLEANVDLSPERFKPPRNQSAAEQLR